MPIDLRREGIVAAACLVVACGGAPPAAPRAASGEADARAPWVEPGTPDDRVAAVRANYDRTWRILSTQTGKTPLAPTLRVYSTRDRFLADLRRAGFSAEDVESFRRVGGAPRPMMGTLWVPPDMQLSNVCHELTHSFIEALCGDGYKRAKWLDEGFATWFERDECGARGYPPSAPVKLADMQSDEQWTALRAANMSRVYGSAAAVVARLVARFGEDRVLRLFAALRDRELEPAMREVLGIDLVGAQAIADEPPPPSIEAGVDPGRAKAIVETYLRTWSYLTDLAGRPVAAPELVVYRTRDDFLGDLRAVGFPDSMVTMFVRGGTPRPMPGAAWAAWMPPEPEPCAVAELLAQGFVRLLAGDAYRRARWLDAGFALLVAKRMCAGADVASPAPQRIALTDMASDAQFSALRSSDARRVEGNALAAVERLVARFGEKAVAQLIEALPDGGLEPAARKVLGMDMAGVQAVVDGKAW